MATPSQQLRFARQLKIHAAKRRNLEELTSLKGEVELLRASASHVREPSEQIYTQKDLDEAMAKGMAFAASQFEKQVNDLTAQRDTQAKEIERLMSLLVEREESRSDHTVDSESFDHHPSFQQFEREHEDEEQDALAQRFERDSDEAQDPRHHDVRPFLSAKKLEELPEEQVKVMIRELAAKLKDRLPAGTMTRAKMRKPHELLRHLQYLHCELDRYHQEGIEIGKFFPT